MKQKERANQKKRAKQKERANQKTTLSLKWLGACLCAFYLAETMASPLPDWAVDLGVTEADEIYTDHSTWAPEFAHKDGEFAQQDADIIPDQQQTPDQPVMPEKDAEQEPGQNSGDSNEDSSKESNDGPDSSVDQQGNASAALSVEALKQQMLELNRDLLILEEDLLFPASTQVSVFLSMDVGHFFRLDSVKLEINGKQVATHLYTDTQLDALHRGGVQRLHLGNIKSGAHEIAAFFTGQGTHERDYKRAASIELEKGQEPLMLELVIHDSAQKLQPEFQFKTWEL